MGIRHLTRMSLLLVVPLLSACSGNAPQTVTTTTWSSTDPVAAAEPDTLDPAAQLTHHQALPAATRTDLRARAEVHVARWRTFQHAVTVRQDRHFRSWFHASVSDWTRDHLGVGLGNALRELHAAVAIDPSCAEAWAGLGRLSQAVGDLAAARQALDMALATAELGRQDGNALPPEVETRIHRDLAWTLRDLALWNDGLAAVDRGLAFAPGDRELELVRGLLLAGAGRTSEAMAAAAALPAMRYPQYDFVYYGLKYQESIYANNWIRAMAHLRLGDAAMARQILGVLDHYSYRARLPHWDRFWRDAGLVAELAGDDEAPLWYAMGHISNPYLGFVPIRAENVAPQYLGLPDPRMPVYTCFGGRNYVGGSPLTYAAAQINRMAMAWSDGERREIGVRALTMLEILGRRGVVPGYAHAMRGRILYANGDYAAAEAALVTAHGHLAEEEKVDPVTSLMLGVLALRNERNAEAEAFLNETLAADAEQPAAWRSLGIACARQGKLVQARRAMDHAVEMDPANVAGRYNRGLFHLQAKDYAAAAGDLMEAYRQDPHNHEVQHVLQMAAAGARQSGVALATTGEVAAGHNGNADPELVAAEARLQALFALPDSLREEHATASERIGELERAYAVDGDPGLRKVLALAYVDEGRYEEVQLLLGPEWGRGLAPEEEIMLLYADRQLGEQERADALVDELLAGEAGTGNPYLWAFLALKMRTDNMRGNIADLSEVNKRYLKYSEGTKARSYGFPPLDKLTEWMQDGFSNAREYRLNNEIPQEPVAPRWFREVNAANNETGRK